MTTIGMICMVVGLFAIAIGWNAKPKSGMGLGAGALMTAGGMFIGIGGNPARDMPNGSPPMVVMGFMLVICGIVLLVIQIVKSQEKAKEVNQKAAEAKLVSFYDACIQEGVRSCVSPRDTQKAQLIADRMGVTYPGGIAALYEQARQAKHGDDAAKQNKKLQELMEKELASYNRLTRYAAFSGRDKRVRMLSDQRADALARAKTMHDGSLAIVSGSQQKEHDWALHGGIASGIAGGAAGVATAMDIQRKNAQIRAQNEANLKALSPLIGASFDAEMRAKREAENLEKQINEAKIKLVSEMPAQQVLEHLHFSESNVEVSTTGAFTVKTKVTAGNLTVYDNPSAVADGTILAKVYQDGSFVGVAQLVLPTYGVGKSSVSLEGICLSGAVTGKLCTVQFAATNLWAMEY